MNEQTNKLGPSVWVKKWVDYSTKYGLGYSLSNKTTGVYFNDNTKLLRHMKGQKLEYFYREGASRTDSVATYNVDNYPKELNKKIKTKLRPDVGNCYCINVACCAFIVKFLVSKNPRMCIIHNIM